MIYKLKNIKKKLKIKCELNIDNIDKKDVKKLLVIQKVIKKLKKGKLQLKDKIKKKMEKSGMNEIIKEIEEIDKNL